MSVQAQIQAQAPLAVEAAPVLLSERNGSIAILTLNRPDARNSLSQAMLDALGQACSAVAADRSVHAVVLTANGPVFSAGHDLKELNSRRQDSDHGRGFFERVLALCACVMQQIVRLPQPVIAAVQGTATAAGCQLVASCDLAVASSTARFATPGVNIGLFCSTPMVALSRNVARKHAMEMLLIGEPVSANDALRMGLVNHVVEPGDERAKALELARKIAAKSAHVVGIGKEAFYQQIEMGLAQAYDRAVAVMVENMMACDAEEGISAFIGKRPPTWRDSL